MVQGILSSLPKIKVYTNAGRFQRMSPYLHYSHVRPQLPAMHGTFIIIRLLQTGIDPEVLYFKLGYLVLNGRPPSAQDRVFSQNGELYRTSQ